MHGDGSEAVLLCVDVVGTGRVIQLQSPLEILAHSAYIRAAMRFETARDKEYQGPVRLSATAESEWCPAEVLWFLETGKIKPQMYSSQRALLLLMEYSGASY